MQSTYQRLHHRNIENALSLLDPRKLREFGLMFCGGTLVALEHGEHRESIDIDFVSQDLLMYRKLRNAISSEGMSCLFSSANPVVKGSERSNRYAVKAMLKNGASNIKLEIFSEDRIDFFEPTLFAGSAANLCVPAIAKPDRLTAKLIANVDRGVDTSTFSKDIVDILILSETLSDKDLEQGFLKAHAIYTKEDVCRYLELALEPLQDMAYIEETAKHLHMDTSHLESMVKQGTWNLKNRGHIDLEDYQSGIEP